MLEAGSLERMGEMANRRGRYPVEVRERAVRMVFEHQGEYATQWNAIVSIAEKAGTPAETLRKWVRQAEVDGGSRPGDQRRTRSSSARTASCGARTRTRQTARVGGFPERVRVVRARHPLEG